MGCVCFWGVEWGFTGEVAGLVSFCRSSERGDFRIRSGRSLDKLAKSVECASPSCSSLPPSFRTSLFEKKERIFHTSSFPLP